MADHEPPDTGADVSRLTETMALAALGGGSYDWQIVRCQRRYTVLLHAPYWSIPLAETANTLAEAIAAVLAEERARRPGAAVSARDGSGK